MPKSPKKAPTKSVAKKETPKSKSKKEPKMNFMMKLLKQRDEMRKQLGQPGYPHAVKPAPQSNPREAIMKNTGFSRFAGPRRKAG